MKRKLLIPLLLIPFAMAAQEVKDFGIKFSGFAKTDVFYDTRQSATIREGHFMLYPLAASFDKDKKDINAKPSFNMLSIQSRITGKISGPDAFGAKTSGLIEADFFGNETSSFSDLNGFRLRHAIAKLNWTSTELIAGQYWHPFFVTDCFPGTVSFNTGVPFQPFSRNPQIRVSQQLGMIKITAAALSQRDFTSPGGSVVLRNSGIPDMHLQLQAKIGDNIITGIGGGYKTLKPRLTTDSGYITEKTVSGLSGIAYLKVKTSPVTVKLEGVYGQNLFDVIMLGGYTYKYTEDQAIINKNDFDYVTINNYSVWTDIHTNGEKFQAGVFAGYTKILGSDKNILNWASPSIATARGANIDYVYRVSPRVMFTSGKTQIAFETEYTTAAYGNTINSLAEIQDKSDVYPKAEIKTYSNIRFLASIYYFF